MAIDLTKYGIKDSLNRKEVLDARKKKQFYPQELVGTSKERVLGFTHVPASQENRNKASFQPRVKIIETTGNQNFVGREYPIYLAITSSPEWQHLTDATLASFAAACLGQSSSDLDFDCDEALKTLIEMHLNGAFDDENDPCLIFHTQVVKDKQVAEIENGQAVMKTKKRSNHYFNPVEG